MITILTYFQYPEGGLGDAVLASLAMVRNTVVKKLAVNSVPRSGTISKMKIPIAFHHAGPPAELLEMFGISATSIVKAVNELIKM